MLSLQNGKKVICYNCREDDHVARQCKEKKREKDLQYFEDKVLLMKAKERGEVLDAEAEAFIADVECDKPYDEPLAITTTTAFNVDHENAYDSNVVERLKVLESKENATLRKKLVEKEGLLDLTRMEQDRTEKRIMPPKPMLEAHMREIICDLFATSMNEFMANMNIGAGGSGGASGSGGSGGTGGNADGTGVRGAGSTVHELTGCTYATFIKCDPLPFNGTKGAVGLCQWFEKLESVFQISKCKEKDRVKFAMATFRGRALTWWNGRTKAMGIEAANNTP
nr:putative reverse transcriptase domain-containing protein [Tanacetum cinerariifolium]